MAFHSDFTRHPAQVLHIRSWTSHVALGREHIQLGANMSCHALDLHGDNNE